MKDRKALQRVLMHGLDLSHPQIVSWTRTDPNATCDVRIIEYTTNKENRSVVFKSMTDRPRLRKSPSIEREAKTIETVRKTTKIRTPKVLAVDLSKSLWPHDYFLMDQVSGVPLREAIKGTSSAKRQEYLERTASLVAELHEADIGDFPFLPNENYADFVLRRLQDIQDPVFFYLEATGQESLRETLEIAFQQLRGMRPEETERAVINADFGINHLYVDTDGLSLIDWDETAIGDRAWDILFVTRGSIGSAFGFEDEHIRLQTAYEKASGHQLRNADFYRIATSVTSLALCIFEEAYGTNDAFGEVSSRIIKNLERSVVMSLKYTGNTR